MKGRSRILALLILLTAAPGLALAQPARPDLDAMAPPVRQAIERLQSRIDGLIGREATARIELGDAYFALGEAYHAHGLTEFAMSAYLESLELQPAGERAAYYLGCLLQQSGRMEEAVTRFAAVLTQWPENPALLIRLGNVHLELGESATAQRFFERALALEDGLALENSLAAAHYGLGRAAFASGEAAAAVGHFERALELQPEASVVRYPLAQAYRRLGEMEKARFHLERLGQVDVTFPDPGLERLSRIAATSALQVVLSLAADLEDFSARDYLGFTLGQLGKTVGSVEYLRQVIASKGAAAEKVELARIHYAVAGLLALRGNDDEAKTELRSAVRLAPNFVAAHVMLANALARTDDFARAAGHYDRAIELEPDLTEAWLKRSAVRMRLGQEERALAELRELTGGRPEVGAGWLRLAAILQRRGEVTAAMAAYEKAIVLDLADREKAMAHRGLADLLRERGRLDEAAVQFRAALSFDPSSAEGSVGPSLLLITLDTTRADHLGPYGAPDADTPTLSALAADGIVFERAYATTPVTLPSHTSLLTGLDPTGHGVRNNGRHYVADSTTTLAEILRAEGFQTAAFLSAAVLDRRYGLAQGFDLYDDDLTRAKPKEPRMIAERPAEVTISAALDWLGQVKATDRFFLWVHLFDPHIPYEPPSPYKERFRGRPYEGEIAYMDAQIGRLLEHPRLSRDQAVVTAIADHGESLGEHGEATHAMLAYDSTLHIPWILRLPEGPRGKRLTHAVSQVDLLPTMVELLGLDIPFELSVTGLSQVAAIRGAALPPSRLLYGESLVAFYTYGWAQLRVAREGSWKLIRAPKPELYDLATDPGETKNLISQESGRAADLNRAANLERRLTALIGEETEAEALPVDRHAEAQLRSLGYLGSRGTGNRRERPDPKDVIDLHGSIEKAEALLSRRDFKAAISELRAVLRRDPENLTAISGLARAYGETGRDEDAATALRRALELAPEDAGLHLTMATLLGRGGQFEQALAEVEVALALEPRSLDARIEKARYLARAGRRAEVAPLLRTALADDADHPRLNVHYAELVESPAGELRPAEERLRRAVRQEPYLAAGWRVLGETLEAAGRSEDARTAYRSGLEYQPDDPTLREGLGLLLIRLGELDGAESHLRRVQGLLQASRVPAVVHDGLASVLVRRGDWSGAEAEARKAVKLDSDLASGWNNLAIAQEEQGDAQGAWASYERAVAADAELWQARYNQGILARKIRRFKEAATAFEKVLVRVPDHAGSHYELGLLCAGPLGDPARARRHLEASLRSDPSHPRVAQIRQVLAELP